MNRSAERGTAHHAAARVFALVLVFITMITMMPMLYGESYAQEARTKSNRAAAGQADAKVTTGTTRTAGAALSQAGKAVKRADSAVKRADSAEAQEAQGKVITADKLAAASKLDYYYQFLTKYEKQIYNALLTLAQDPFSGNIVKLAPEDNSFNFYLSLNTAYDAFCYDHPEFYWLKMTDANNGTGVRFMFKAEKNPENESLFIFRLWLDLSSLSAGSPFCLFTDEAGYKKTQADFDKAVDEFLEDIERNHSHAVVARAISEKLCDMVGFDEEAAEKYPGTALDVHTAYGALVNGRAVSSGFAGAYLYLLKKCGIPAAAIRGEGRRASEESRLKPGSVEGVYDWNTVKLGGSWYEFDLTRTKTGFFQYLFQTTADMEESGCMRDKSSVFAHAPIADGTYFSFRYMVGFGKHEILGSSVTPVVIKGGKKYPLDAAPRPVKTGRNRRTWKIRFLNKRAGHMVTSIYSVKLKNYPGSRKTFKKAVWNRKTQTLTLHLNTKALKSKTRSDANKLRLNVEYDNGVTTSFIDRVYMKGKGGGTSIRYSGK